MTRDAQQAADAIVNELSTYSLDDILLTVSKKTARTFLANFLAGWQAEIGGEQAGQLLQRASSAEGVTGTDTRPGQVPATPIDTDALAREIGSWAFDYWRGDRSKGETVTRGVKRILDEAIGGQR